MSRARVVIAMLLAASSAGCYDARLDAIVAGDASTPSDAAASAPDAASTSGPAATCAPGADSEREPDDTPATATTSAAPAVCGRVAGADVDYVALVATDAGAPPNVAVDRLGGDDAIVVQVFVEGALVGGGSAAANGATSVSVAVPGGSTGPALVRLAASDGGLADYVVRATP